MHVSSLVQRNSTYQSNNLAPVYYLITILLVLVCCTYLKQRRLRTVVVQTQLVVLILEFSLLLMACQPFWWRQMKQLYWLFVSHLALLLLLIRLHIVLELNQQSALHLLNLQFLQLLVSLSRLLRLHTCCHYLTTTLLFSPRVWRGYVLLLHRNLFQYLLFRHIRKSRAYQEQEVLQTNNILLLFLLLTCINLITPQRTSLNGACNGETFPSILQN